MERIDEKKVLFLRVDHWFLEYFFEMSERINGIETGFFVNQEIERIEHLCRKLGAISFSKASTIKAENIIGKKKIFDTVYKEHWNLPKRYCWRYPDTEFAQILFFKVEFGTNRSVNLRKKLKGIRFVKGVYSSIERFQSIV